MFQNNISHVFLVIVYCLFAIDIYHVVSSDGSSQSVLTDRHQCMFSLHVYITVELSCTS